MLSGVFCCKLDGESEEKYNKNVNKLLFVEVAG